MRFRITSQYGELSEVRDHVHRGIDYAMGENTVITAIKEGVVTRIADFGDVSGGKMLFLKMNDGKTAVFGHLNDFLVKEGQRVVEGQKIALSGNTGDSTGPHLHFAIKDNGSFINPESYNNLIQTMTEKKGPLSGLWETIKERGQVNTYDKWNPLETILNWLGEGIRDSATWFMSDVYPSIYQSIPEFGACVTILAGVLIMISGNISKFTTYYGITMTALVLWIING